MGMHNRLWGETSVEYLQLEEWQRWEGNQLLHTERLRLYQAHLEINETLITAPTPAPRRALGCAVRAGLARSGRSRLLGALGPPGRWLG